MKQLLQKIRHYISPVYVVLFVASFILWFIAKLSYTYTTEQTFRVRVGEEKFAVTCVVEGVGTNLFGYRVYHNRNLRIPLDELRTGCSTEEGSVGMLTIDPASLRNAIAVRCTDIKIVSIGDVPKINPPTK
jgi:hypothetical protein